MGIFSKARRKSTTPFVLAVWLFALMASMAHACGLDEALAQAVMSAPASAGHQAPTSDGPLACDQFCADDNPLLAKLKGVADLSPGAAIVTLASVSGIHVDAFPRAYEALPAPDPPPGIAINTRFVRLAL